MAIDWTQLITKYRGQWIALADDEVTVIACALSAKEAHSRALEMYPAPILYRVPDNLEAFVGYEVRV